MKNAKTSKIIFHVLSFLMCAVILGMLACTFSPYFTITQPYHFILNPDPQPVDYTLVDLIWTETKLIDEHFAANYADFNINDYVTNLALSFIFGLGAVVSCIWHFYNNVKRYPAMTSGVVSNLCALCWSLFSLLGYLNNAMLDLGVEAYKGIRTVIIILAFVGTVFAIARFVIWLITEVKAHKEMKARLAKL